MASDILIPVRMTVADMDRYDVQSFRCGTEPHENLLADWLKQQSADAVRRRHKVWLYRAQADEGRQLVGYGSLTKGKIEITEEDDSKNEMKVMEIPMLALHRDFWGCPKGASNPEEKYSRQIVRHLQQEAQRWQANGQNVERLLALYVHPKAIKAQELYLACGFEFAPNRFLPDPDIPPEVAPGFLGMDYMW